MVDRITPHFRLREFIRSEAAEQAGIRNSVRPEHLPNIVATSVGLEQVRSFIGGHAITIHSGYRNPEVNELVGGVRNSAHAEGYAADITAAGYSSLELAATISASPLVFDQLIHEPSRGVVHISFDPRLRREVLTQVGGPGTPFEKGLSA